MTDKIDPPWAEELVRLFDEQCEIYTVLRDLSGRQAELIAAAETEPLLSLLSERQRLVDALTDNNTRVEPYRRRWSDFWQRLSEPTQTKIQTFIDRIRAILDEIVAADQVAQADLSEQRGQVGAQLSQMNTGHVVNRAYGGGSSFVESRYTDESG